MSAFYYHVHPLSSPMLDEIDRTDRPKVVVPFEAYKDVSNIATIDNQAVVAHYMSLNAENRTLLLDELSNYLLGLTGPNEWRDLWSNTRLGRGSIPDHISDENTLVCALMEFGEQGRRPEYNYGSRMPVRERARFVFVARGGKIRGEGYRQARQCAEDAYVALGSINTQDLL